MKNVKQVVSAFVITLALVFFLANHSQAQVDTTAKKDTTAAPPPATTTGTAPAEKPKGKSTFIIYAGPNVSALNVESDQLNKDSKAGFHVGLSWRKSGFFYTQLGVRYNNPVYSVFPRTSTGSGDHEFSVSDIDVPITVGLNFLGGRILGLRVFLGAVPAFNIGVGDNDQGISKDDVNTFIFYGQAGIGVDVLFLAIDLGYHYGFSDLFKDYESKPGQGFLNIGFKF